MRMCNGLSWLRLSLLVGFVAHSFELLTYFPRDFVSNPIPVPIILPSLDNRDSNLDTVVGCSVRRQLWNHPASCPVDTGGAFSLEVSRLWCEADHSPSSAVKVENVCTFSPVRRHVVMFNKARGQLYLLAWPPLLSSLYHHHYHYHLILSAQPSLVCLLPFVRGSCSSVSPQVSS
jgi:hypothetical protein